MGAPKHARLLCRVLSIDGPMPGREGAYGVPKLAQPLRNTSNKKTSDWFGAGKGWFRTAGPRAKAHSSWGEAAMGNPRLEIEKVK